MSRSKFFVLQNLAGSSHETAFTMTEPSFKDGLTCPACARPLLGKEWLPPHRVELEVRGKKLGDIAFGPGADLLVSERFLKAYRDKKLSGLFGLRQVEITAVRPKKAAPRKGPPPFFLGLAGYGMTQVDDKRSHIVREGQPDCLQCLGGSTVSSVSGFTIDEPTWSGEDIFVPWGLDQCLVVTERVLALRDEHELTNVSLVPTDEFTWPSAP